jgi:hypothetical protein
MPPASKEHHHRSAKRKFFPKTECHFFFLLTRLAAQAPLPKRTITTETTKNRLDVMVEDTATEKSCRRVADEAAEPRKTMPDRCATAGVCRLQQQKSAIFCVKCP